jgi:CobN/Magnesium Chelatase
MAAEGISNGAARLFSNPAGDYGSMVNERVGASSWENGEELGDTWASRNSFSYGRCAPFVLALRVESDAGAPGIREGQVPVTCLTF